jgi:hypothetical protein
MSAVGKLVYTNNTKVLVKSGHSVFSPVSDVWEIEIGFQDIIIKTYYKTGTEEIIEKYKDITKLYIKGNLEEYSMYDVQLQDAVKSYRPDDVVRVILKFKRVDNV